MIIGPGSILGGYLIERQLGSGGMGTVYLARHPALPRHDALKVLWPHLASDPEYRARFEREANIAAALDHPNIVSVLNKGEDQGCLWIALQYVNGTDADSAVTRDAASMTVARVLHVITEIGKGLDHAHRAGLLHRDIKPANFLLASGIPGEERVLLADFGIAKPSEDATQLTKTGTFLATLAYASPEQLSGRPLDSRSDIYSLGCSFYRLLVNQNPYPGTQPLNVMMGHINEPVPRITAVRPDLPRALDDVLARALAKSPVDRYPTCSDFTEAVRMAVAQQVVGNTAPELDSAAPFARLAAENAAKREAAARAAAAAEVADRSARSSRAGVVSFARLAAQRAESASSAETAVLAPGRVRDGSDAAAGQSATFVGDAPNLVYPAVGGARPIPRVSADRGAVEAVRISALRHRPWMILAALVAGVLLVATVIYAIGRDGDRASAGPAAGLPNPCELLTDDMNGELELRSPRPYSSATSRACAWGSKRQGGPTVALDLLTSGMMVTGDPTYQAIRIGNAVDGSRWFNGNKDSAPTCVVMWPTGHGHAKLSVVIPTARGGADEVCPIASRLADNIFPKSRG
ncbi:serine/threonine-protein kinase [Nocardia sp. NPDC056100]|uniref:serine/threonine-protein kinase n=1 Tax=Nocardia sp. NPDC056100 TaxID=3345712 RepID=UPI0035DE8407